MEAFQLKKFLHLLVILTVTTVTFVGVHLSMAQSIQIQKPQLQPRVYKIEELKNLRASDLRDMDIIEIKGKRLTVKEAKDLVRRDLKGGDPNDPKKIAQALISRYQTEREISAKKPLPPGPSRLPGPGTNLRVVNLFIDQANGYVSATVENLGSPMTRDAKIRLYFNNVQIKECAWPMTLKKTMCSKYAFEPNDPPPKCNWGKMDVKVHVQIIAGEGEHEADKSGQYKEGMLYARQDLTVDHFTKDPGNRTQVVFRNKGICDSSTWSYKVYKDGMQLIQTKGPLGSLKAGGMTMDTLNPQPPQGTTSLKVEVVPTNPEYELRSDNNTYSADISGLSYNPSGFDLTVTDIKLRGETPGGRNLSPDNIDYYTIIPIIKNIGNADMPALSIKFETFIDGVSSGENLCSFSLERQQEFIFPDYCRTGATLPPGTHSVKFQIKTHDFFDGNNSLSKTMLRP